MDYEFRIKIAEKELAHLKEMQSLFLARQDAHDASIAMLDKITGQIEANLEQITALQLVTERKLQNLIDVLVREHGNGRSVA